MLPTEDTVGNRTYFSYDNAKRLASVRYPDDTAVRYTYNDMDQVVQVGLAANYASPISTVMATYQYDVEGRLATYTNARGKTWSYTYDVMDRPKTTRDPINALSQAEYDTNGNLIKTIDPMGHEARFVYDIGKGDRPLTERYYQYSPLNPNIADVEVNYAYDAATHLLSSVSNSGSTAQKISGGTTNYTYDPLDRLLTEVGPSNYTVINRDNFGRVTSVIKDGVQSESYSYDSWDRVVSVSNTRTLASGQDTKVINYSYDNLGRPTGYSTNGAGYSVSYADNGFVTSSTTSAGSMSLTSLYQYTWDGKIVAEAWSRRQSGSLVGGSTDTYAYDLFGQLIGASVLGNSFSYTYDLAGNRLTETKNGLTKNFSYDDANRLLWASVGYQFSSSLSYDGNGNLTNIMDNGSMGGVIPGLALSWNMFGQLTSSAHQNGSNTFGYDMFGDRGSKNGSAISSFGGNRGGDLTVGLDSFVQTSSGAMVLQNHRGDVVALSGSDGSSSGSTYDPFGNRLSAWTTGSGLAASSVYGFTGAEELYNGQTTDLVYMRARYYHPGLGRFISQDPIGFAGGTNLYAYCGNDPINFTDPLGLAPNDSLLAAGGALYGAGEMAVGMAQLTLRSQLDPLGQAMDGLAFGIHAYHCPKKVFGAIYDSFAFWNTDDPFEFGRRFMNTGLTLVTLGEGGVSGVKAASAARATGCAATPWQTIKAFFGFQKCFVAGTPVLMADGSSKAIENVKAGDLVLSKDEKTGEIVKRKVVETKVRTADATLVVEVAGGGRVETTAEHPFYVEGKGWTPAGQLAIGNAIVTRAGPSVKVVKIEKKEKSATVYNFEVEDTHSYFVGAEGERGRKKGRDNGWLWVHNYNRPSPALKGDPYHPDVVEARIKPPYEPNPAHIKGSSYNHKKTPEPADVLEVYKGAVLYKPGTWFGKAGTGVWYQYFSNADMTKVHFAGQVKSSVLKQRVPPDIADIFGGY